MDIKDFYPVCINLKERTDRWTESQLEFSKAKIDVVRVDGLKDENPIVGCAKSHFNVLDFCLSINKHAMIFEDDVLFSDKIFKLYWYLKGLDGLEWDMLYLGANVTSPIYQVNEYFGRLTSAQATHAYMVNKEFIPTILAQESKVGKHMDLIYSENIVPYHRCYITIPMFAIQRPSYSNIEKKDVDYSWMYERYKLQLVEKGKG